MENSLSMMWSGDPSNSGYWSQVHMQLLVLWLTSSCSDKLLNAKLSQRYFSQATLNSRESLRAIQDVEHKLLGEFKPHWGLSSTNKLIHMLCKGINSMSLQSDWWAKSLNRFLSPAQILTENNWLVFKLVDINELMNTIQMHGIKHVMYMHLCFYNFILLFNFIFLHETVWFLICPASIDAVKSSLHCMSNKFPLRSIHWMNCIFTACIRDATSVYIVLHHILCYYSDSNQLNQFANVISIPHNNYFAPFNVWNLLNFPRCSDRFTTCLYNADSLSEEKLEFWIIYWRNSANTSVGAKPLISFLPSVLFQVPFSIFSAHLSYPCTYKDLIPQASPPYREKMLPFTEVFTHPQLEIFLQLLIHRSWRGFGFDKLRHVQFPLNEINPNGVWIGAYCGLENVT